MKKLLLLLFLFITFSSNAQLYLTLNGQNESSQGSCDGSLDLTINNGTPPFMIHWQRTFFDFNQGGIVTENFYTEDLTNVCAGNYQVNVWDSNCIETVTSFTVFSNGSQIHNILPTNISDVSGVGICDGIIDFTNSNQVDSFNIMNAVNPNTPLPTYNNLCSGQYILDIYHSGGINRNLGIQLGESLYNCSDTMSIYVANSATSGIGNCDGFANAIIYGGTPPYSYAYSNGGNTAQETNLCAGIHSLTVMDANGVIRSTNFTIENPFSYLFNINISSTPLLDTLYTAAAINCNFDFSLGIDSAYIDTFNYSQDSVNITWAVFQNGNDWYFNETYIVDTIGYQAAVLSVYCDSVRSNQTFSVLDYLNISSSITSLNKEIDLNNTIKIFPNPVNENLHINFVKYYSNNYNASLFNINGSKLKEFKLDKNNYLVNVKDLSKGVYFIKIESNSEIITKKIIKQ